MIAFRKISIRFAGFMLLSIAIAHSAMAQGGNADSLKSMSYIQNKFIKVGIDLNLGGAITYVADAKKTGKPDQ